MGKRGLIILGIVILLVALIFIFISCNEDDEEDGAQIANPAAVYCIEQGYNYEIRENDLGQYGVCIFENSSECDAWECFRRECLG